MENIEIIMRRAAEHLEIEEDMALPAIQWVMEHRVIAEALYDPEDPFPDRSIRAEIKRAISKRDNAFLGLLLYQKARQDQAT